MAKTKGPLMSLDAHGSFGRVLTYSHRKSGRQVRAYNKPLVAPSAKQRAQRRLTEFLVAQWQNMSAGDKATWEANAAKSGLNLEGYHYFLREAQRDLYTHHGLCGYWHCNEIVGGKVLDISGRANHGTLKPSYPANAPVLVDSYKTKFSKGLLYDGVDEYVDCGVGQTLAFDASEGFTIGMVVYVPTLEKKTTIRKGAFEVSGYYFSIDVDGGLILRDDRASDLHEQESVNKISAAKWHDLYYIYNNGVLIPFIDGVQSTIITRGTPAFTDDIITTFAINDTFGGGSIHAIIDEVCYYNRILSAAEIATRYKFAMRKVD